MVSAISHYRPAILSTTVGHWHDRAVEKLHSLEHRLDVAIPNVTLQSKYDHLVHLIEEKMAPINAWIDNNGDGSFPAKLAVGLCKLPLRVARNIIITLFKLIHAILNTLIHPVKSLIHLGKFLIDLLFALTQPQTWATIGAGLMGATLGQAWVLATPVGLITTLIGTALVIAGMSAEAILAAYHARVGHRLTAVKDATCSVLSKLPESFATGLVIGAITGAIQRALIERQKVDYNNAKLEFRKLKLQELKEQYTNFPQKVDEWINKNHLPHPVKEMIDNRWLGQSPSVHMTWKGDALDKLLAKYPQLGGALDQIDQISYYSSDPTKLYVEAFSDPQWNTPFSLDEVSSWTRTYTNREVFLPNGFPPMNL